MEENDGTTAVLRRFRRFFVVGLLIIEISV